MRRSDDWEPRCDRIRFAPAVPCGTTALYPGLADLSQRIVRSQHIVTAIDRIDLERGRIGLIPHLAGQHASPRQIDLLAVGELSWFDQSGDTVQDHILPRMRHVAAEVDLDVPNQIRLVFVDPVLKIDLPRFIQEDRRRSALRRTTGQSIVLVLMPFTSSCMKR